MHAFVFFQGGTLVLQHTDEIEHVPVPFQFVKSRWRCEAYHYSSVLPWIWGQDIHNAVRRWQRLRLNLSDTKELYDDQTKALDAWKQAEKRGALHREPDGERILVFTESSEVAYTIARQWLIPAIFHETGVAKRKHILDAFQAGEYRVIATSKVLNEGIDAPEAKVAIVLGGGSSKREYIQRLGRILRKQEQREAVRYEILARKTIEEGKVRRHYVCQEQC